MRVINIKQNRVNLKEGQTIGTCDPAVRIAKVDDNVRSSHKQRGLTESFPNTWEHLLEKEMNRAMEFLNEIKDI